MNHKPDIQHLIIRYLNGECSVAEKLQLTQWIEQSDKNKNIYYQIKDIWDATLKTEDRTNNALMKFFKLQATRNNSAKKVLNVWKAIAGVAAVLAIGFISHFMLQLETSEVVTQQESAIVSIKVPLGSRSEVSLADGTVVVLNSGSELHYPNVFAKGKREVKVSGEAFFSVKSDKTNPFVVKTNDFDVQVTGTRFNVSSYGDDAFSSVTLVEGKVGVQFKNENKVVNILQGQQLNLDRKNRNYYIEESDVEIEIAWKDGEFWFKDISFPALIKRLERWYDVKLYFTASELDKIRYSGHFKNQETIWQVLDALKLTTPIDYEKTGFREFEIIYKLK